MSLHNGRSRHGLGRRRGRHARGRKRPAAGRPADGGRFRRRAPRCSRRASQDRRGTPRARTLGTLGRDDGWNRHVSAGLHTGGDRGSDRTARARDCRGAARRRDPADAARVTRTRRRRCARPHTDRQPSRVSWRSARRLPHPATRARACPRATRRRGDRAQTNVTVAALPVRFARLVKIEHTVFALPFAYVGALLCVRKIPPTHDLVWIMFAMVGARSLAMGLNRLIDAEIDARNPRTAGRELPRGLLTQSQVVAFCVGALALFVVAVFQLEPIVRWLWPIPVAAFVIYPYLKRWTSLAHAWLGAVDGLA